MHGRHGHALERSTGVYVKSFARSAAGVEVQASALRPEPVLCAVVGHLLGPAVLQCPTLAPFDSFISDRLRAVRGDGFVQGLCSLAWCECLVRQVRYHQCLGYFLGAASLTAPVEGGMDQHSNAERCAEALGMAQGALRQLLAGGSGAAPPLGRAQARRAHALALEALGYALVASLSQPPLVRCSVLALSTPLLQHAPPSAAAAWRAVLAPCLAWAGGRWPAFVRHLTAPPGAQQQQQQQQPPPRPPAVLCALCALHRHLPLARARLLQALCEALGVPPARPPVLQLGALQAALGFSSGSAAGPGQQQGSSGVEGEPGWFRAARFVAQLGVEVRQGGGEAASASWLWELRAQWARGEQGAQLAAAGLGAVMSKATRLPLGGREGMQQAEALRAAVALAPAREDGFLPPQAQGASAVGALLEVINHAGEEAEAGGE